VQAKLEAVKKSKLADAGSYSYPYADLAGITQMVYPLLGEHGLAFITAPDYVGERYTLVGSIEHVSGERRTGFFPLNDRATPQQIGSALTYGRRYLLGCLTGVVTEEDDDGKAASQASESSERPKPQRAKPKPKPDPDPVSPDAVTKAQLAKLGALFNANALKDRYQRLAYTSGLIKRDITTSNELTRDEASQLIDHLEQLAEGTII
jgi:hypothetical protein